MKKIIALMAAVTVIISILNISAFATSDSSAMTSQEYYAAQSDLIDKFCNGDITYSQFQTQSQAVTNDYITANTFGGVIEAGALTASNNIAAVSKKIGATVDKWGDSARDRVSDWWNDICNRRNVPTKDIQTSTTDFMGYGAKIEYYTNGKITSVYFCDYMTFYPDSSPGQNNLCTNGVIHCYSVNSNGTLKYNYDLNVGSWYQYPSDTSKSNFCKFYGDIRYSDGTSAPSDDEFVTGTIKDFDEMDERDLEDILSDFAEEMERQNPDLSSIEGLLNAIYARMGTLDSDNDNDLLASINANILALLEADNKKDEEEEKTNEELLNALLEIRDSLKNGTLGTVPESHGHEISGIVYNVIPLDKNFLNKLFHDKENLKVEYEKKVYYLEDCGCLKLGDKYYTPNMNYDSYAFADYDFSNDNINIDTDKYVNFDFTNYNDVSVKLTASQRKKIDNIVDLIYKMVSQAVPYAAITSAFAPFEVIIFNTAVPEDIVLNFNGTDEVGGFSATILSVSFFQNSYVAAAMGIVKPFLTVVIGYCWLKVMRRKAVSMLG